MTAKRRVQKFGANQGESLLEQCRQLPGRLRGVCEDAARQRYARHYHPSNPHRRSHVVVDMIMALGLVLSFAAVAFITLVYQRAVQHQQIEVVAVPQQQSVVSGDVVSVDLEIRNNGRQDMTDVTLQIPAAAGFFVSLTEPAMDADGRIPLGTIDGHDSATLRVQGIVLGQVGSAARFNGQLQYQLNGLGGVQEKIVSESIFISGSHLSVDVTMPESLALQKAFPFTIAVRNTSAASSFSNVLVIMDLPPGWQTIESSLPLDPASGNWTIDSIGSLQTVTIEGRAQLLEPINGYANLTVKLYAAPQGLPYLQDESLTAVSVFAPNVTARLRNVPVALRLGEVEEVTVEIANREQHPLLDARLHINVSPEIVDVGPYGEYQWHEGFLDVPVGEIGAGQTMPFTFRLYLRSNINPVQAFGAQEAGFRWLAELHYSREGELITVPFEERLIPFESDLSVSAVGRYASAEQETIGTGPWPPKRGETTTAWIFFQVRNQINPVADAVVTARLPQGVQATGRQSVTAGQALVITTDGRITWRVGNVPDYKSMFDGESISAALEIEIVPEHDEVDTMQLLQNVALTGRDTVTGTQLSVEAPPIEMRNVLTK